MDKDFTLVNWLFGSVKLTKNIDPDKYKYSDYSIGFDSCSEYLLSDGSYGKSVIIFGANMISSAHVCNKGEDILVLGQGPTQGLDDATLTVEAKYPINFIKSNERFVLSLHCNGNSSFLFVNTTIICKFKAKDSEIKKYSFCLGNVSKDFTIDKMKRKTRLLICWLILMKL